jgi:hypothetical protein
MEECIGTKFEFTISKDEKFYISFEPLCNHSTHEKGDVVNVSLTVFSDKKLEQEEAYELENDDVDFYINLIPFPLEYEFTLTVGGMVVDEFSCR